MFNKKVKIEIKSWTGAILFKYEKENNTIKDTTVEANLRGADLCWDDLQGYKIEKAAIFTGLYKYLVIPFVTDKGEKRIAMGCHNRSVEDWENDFWNNPGEFPNTGDEASKLRLLAFETAKKWFEIAN